jgi:hypothetical protein
VAGFNQFFDDPSATEWGEVPPSTKFKGVRRAGVLRRDLKIAAPARDGSRGGAGGRERLARAYLFGATR